MRRRLVLLLALAASPEALAGTISVGWSAVEDPRLVEYRVCYGVGTLDDSSPCDAVVPCPGSTCAHVVDPVPDCTEMHVSIKSVGASETSSWPTDGDGVPIVGRWWAVPVISDVTWDETGIHTIIGSNFNVGARVRLDGVWVADIDTIVVDCHTVKIPSRPAVEVLVWQADDVNAAGIAPGFLYVSPLVAPIAFTISGGFPGPPA